MDDHGIYAAVLIEVQENPHLFEEIRLDLKEHNLYPRLVESDGRWALAIYPNPPRKPSNYTVNIVMFLLTLFTTVWAGAILWASRSRELLGLDYFSVLFSPVDVSLGALTFAFPLVLILGSHELGHYFMSRIYRVDASLPYFIPIPPIVSPFGTFGALISMKENISNRKALVDIGAAGPIAGFLVAIPVTALGLILTNRYPAPLTDMVDGNVYMMINPPLLFDALSRLLGVSSDGNIFPTALAGWIGFFVTALNLFPVGQLDGGHIVRGIFGKWAQYISYATVGLLIILGFVTGFTTYLFFAVLIMFMGARHPPPLDDLSPVKVRQLAAFVFSVLMMIVTFHPVPIEAVEYQEGDIVVIVHHPSLMVDDEVPGICAFTVIDPGAFTEDVEIVLSVGGERLVPSLLPEPPSGLDVILAGGGKVHASYEHGGLHLYLLDPVGRRIDKGGMATWRIASLSDVPVDELGFGELNITFDADDISRKAVISLTARKDAIITDRTHLDRSIDTMVAGVVLASDVAEDEVLITIGYEGTDSPYRVFLTPLNGTGSWEYPILGSVLDISPKAGGPFQLNVRKDPASSDIVLPFVIEAYRPVDGDSTDLSMQFGLSTTNGTWRLTISDLFTLG
jgi:Zn-dependent protease